MGFGYATALKAAEPNYDRWTPRAQADAAVRVLDRGCRAQQPAEHAGAPAPAPSPMPVKNDRAIQCERGVVRPRSPWTSQ